MIFPIMLGLLLTVPEDRPVQEASIEVTAGGRIHKFSVNSSEGVSETRGMMLRGYLDGEWFNYTCKSSSRRFGRYLTSIAFCEDPNGGPFTEFILRDIKERPMGGAFWYAIGCWDGVAHRTPIPPEGESVLVGDVTISATCNK